MLGNIIPTQEGLGLRVTIKVQGFCLEVSDLSVLGAVGGSLSWSLWGEILLMEEILHHLNGGF